MKSLKSLATGFVPFFLFPLTTLTAPANGPTLTYAGGIEVPATPPVRSPTFGSPGPFSGVASITGALTGPTVLGTALSPKPISTAATTYPSDGELHDPQPAPFIPGGGLGTNGTTPVYNVKSDYDFQSLALALYWEWLKVNLFETGLSQFTTQQFLAVGLTASDRALIAHMAGQALGEATLLSNMLGPAAPLPCGYNFPFTDVLGFLDFSQKITTMGESTIYGFLPHLNSRAASMLELQSIAVGGCQDMVFRQFLGLFPMPIWFAAAVPQSWGWTLLAPFISSCPDTRLVWENFPALRILNQPNPARSSGASAFNETTGGGLNAVNTTGIAPGETCANSTEGAGCQPAIAPNRTTPLTEAGRTVSLQWDMPGKLVGPNNSYVTTSPGGEATFVAWVTQLNVSYTELTNVEMMDGTWKGETTQPSLATFAGDPAVNGTVFIAVTDENLYLTPFNLTLINSHMVAGPALYQAG